MRAPWSPGKPSRWSPQTPDGAESMTRASCCRPARPRGWVTCAARVFPEAERVPGKQAGWLASLQGHPWILPVQSWLLLRLRSTAHEPFKALTAALWEERSSRRVCSEQAPGGAGHSHGRRETTSEGNRVIQDSGRGADCFHCNHVSLTLLHESPVSTVRPCPPLRLALPPSSLSALE